MRNKILFVVDTILIFLVFFTINASEKSLPHNRDIQIEIPKAAKIEVEENKVEKFIEENLIEEESSEEDEPYFIVTDEEREELVRLVHLEGNNQSIECQKGICSVVFNRLESPYFEGNTLEEIIYATGQFTTAKNIPSAVPTQTNYDAVDYVIKNGPTLPYYVCFFRSAYYFKEYTPYCNINNTYFSYRKSHM